MDGIYLTTLGFMALFIIAMMFAAYWRRIHVVGVIASFILILLGLWVANAPILIETGAAGSTITVPATQASTIFFNASKNRTYYTYTSTIESSSTNKTKVFTPILTPFFQFNQLLGVLLALLGVLTGIRFSFAQLSFMQRTGRGF